MKIVLEIVRFQAIRYFRTSKIVMPAGALLAMLYMLYYVKPIGVVDSFAISLLIVFFIMVWIGAAFNELEDPVLEQLILAKIDKDWMSYCGTAVFMALIGCGLSLISVLYPLTADWVNGSGLFNRTLMPDDLISAWIVLSGASFAGGALGSFLHPRIVKDRKAAIGFTCLFALLSLAKGAVIRDFPWAAYVLWLVPSGSDMAACFAGDVYFLPLKVGKVFGVFCLYGCCYWLIKIKLLVRNMF